MKRFSTAEERASALQAIETGAWRDLNIGVPAAWHLREADSRQAAEVARSLLVAVVSGEVASAGGTVVSEAYLRLVIAEEHWLNGRVDDSLEAAQAAADRVEPLGASAVLSDVQWHLATLAGARNDYVQRDALMQASMRCALLVGDEERRLTAKLALNIFYAFEDPVKAFATVGVEVQKFANHDAAGVRCLVSKFLYQCWICTGHMQKGLEAALASQRDAEACGQYRRAVIEACSVGTALVDLGDAEGALEHLQGALDVARSCGSPVLEATVMTKIALAMLHVQRAQSAAEMATRAVERLAGMSKSKTYLMAMHALGSAEVACGNMEGARRCFQSVLKTASGGESLEMRQYAEMGLARVELANGELEKGNRWARDALNRARAAKDMTALVEALQLTAELDLRCNEQRSGEGSASGAERAEGLLREARRLRQDELGGLDDPRMLELLAKSIELQGRDKEALYVLKEAVKCISEQREDLARRRASVMEVKFRTELALREAEHQRQAAEMEARKSVELEHLNEQLRSAMAEVQQTQAMLIKRNDELQIAYTKISELSVTDPLTGLKNRRFFTQAIDNAVAESLRSYQPSGFGDLEATLLGSRQDLLFFLLDLDHFKRVNDEYGHAAGDTVLVQLKDRLRMVTREQDYLIRWGGEEFMVAVRGLNRNQAPLVAERLRLSVSSAAFKLADGRELRMTVSIGFAGFPLEPLEPQRGTWHEAVELADARLYEAKRGGRNRWVGSGALMHPVEPSVESGTVHAGRR